jgi:hypothetical protein
MNRPAKYRTRLRRESTVFELCELKFIWPTSAFVGMRCAQSNRGLARQFDTEARLCFCLDILNAWKRLLSGMRLISQFESLRGQYKITEHLPPNPGINEHVHNMETHVWTHISKNADSGITGKRQLLSFSAISRPPPRTGSVKNEPAR